MHVNKIKLLLFYCCLITQISHLKAEDGYELWLRYAPITDAKWLSEYQNQIKAIAIFGNSPTIEAATEELNRGLLGLFKKNTPLSIRPVFRPKNLSGCLFIVVSSSGMGF